MISFVDDDEEDDMARVTGGGACILCHLALLATLSHASEKRQESQAPPPATVVKASKKVPNPDGKKGAGCHQAGVERVAVEVRARGLKVAFEHLVKTPSGRMKTRYVDIAGKDDQGKVIELHQIGKRSKSGGAVKRERLALEDIEAATGMRPIFHPYNNPTNGACMWDTK